MKPLLVALVLIMTSPCIAAEAGEGLHLTENTAVGIGANNCDFYIDWVERGDSPAVATIWISGFWTAYNIHMVSIGRRPKDLEQGVAGDPFALDAVILGRCYENRAAPLMQVAIDIFEILPFAEDEQGEKP